MSPRSKLLSSALSPLSIRGGGGGGGGSDEGGRSSSSTSSSNSTQETFSNASPLGLEAGINSAGSYCTTPHPFSVVDGSRSTVSIGSNSSYTLSSPKTGGASKRPRVPPIVIPLTPELETGPLSAVESRRMSKDDEMPSRSFRKQIKFGISIPRKLGGGYAVF
ncbi:hypothetical protein BJ741DRAFT_637326 [Chytriomyces cf. hyalinus JEL632]|nr:hypothetical protein BJ741DRAFT_637326 [Chytriomyces cf. hyalinus JEL632]